jgi:hypothetical protein
MSGTCRKQNEGTKDADSLEQKEDGNINEDSDRARKIVPYTYERLRVVSYQ